MFFSVIIPTYNPREYLPRLLSSIERNDCANDIEVILSDDCSDEPFDDILESFSSLNILRISNEEHTGFPRNGRQHGSEVATGQWICFADQDDYFVDHGLDLVKKHIEENHICNYLSSNFVVHVDGSDNYIVLDGHGGWTHGKFYEKAFWDKYKIGFDDVQHCEDINLSTKISCVMLAENIEGYSLNDPVYVWHRRTDSLSEGDYFINSIPDYIRSSIETIIPYVEKVRFNPDKLEAFIRYFVDTLYHIYFVFQSDMLTANRKHILESALLIYPIYERFKNASHLTTSDILERTRNEYRDLFAEDRAEDYRQNPFVEKMTFEQWVNAYLN